MSTTLTISNSGSNVTLTVQSGINSNSHNHDDRYYTESEVDALLSAKADIEGQEIYMNPSYLETDGINTSAAFTTITRTNIEESAYAFDASDEESLFFKFRLPSNWTGNVLQVKVEWTDNSGTGGVVWGVSAGARSNDDPVNVSLGTEVTVTDTVTASGDAMVTSWTSNITPSGSAAAGDTVIFKIARKVGEGGDTLGVDAYLTGLTIKI